MPVEILDCPECGAALVLTPNGPDVEAIHATWHEALAVALYRQSQATVQNADYSGVWARSSRAAVQAFIGG